MLKLPLKRKAKIKIFVFLLVFTAFSTFLFLKIEKRISTVVAEISENAVKAEAAVIINQSIFDKLERDGITYDNLIFTEKDNNGKITALKTNVIELNKLQSELSLIILESLSEFKETNMEIPFGTALGIEWLSGSGPGIKVEVMPVGTVDTEIKSEIVSAGINQSHHRIILNVKANFTIVSAVSNIPTSIEINVCIAETVIVGEVPQSYANINRGLY